MQSPVGHLRMPIILTYMLPVLPYEELNSVGVYIFCTTDKSSTAMIAADINDAPSPIGYSATVRGGSPMSVPQSSTATTLFAQVEPQQWARGQTSSKKYRMPSRQKHDIAVAGSSKMLALRFYQLEMGNCFAGQYLKNQPTSTKRRNGFTLQDVPR